VTRKKTSGNPYGTNEIIKTLFEDYNDGADTWGSSELPEIVLEPEGGKWDLSITIGELWVLNYSPGLAALEYYPGKGQEGETHTFTSDSFLEAIQQIPEMAQSLINQDIYDHPDWLVLKTFIDERMEDRDKLREFASELVREIFEGYDREKINTFLLGPDFDPDYKDFK